MSHATQDSRDSGDNRRRRSRGGQNRNRNQSNSDRRGGGGDERGSRDSRGQGGRRDSKRAEEFRPQAPRPARVYSQPKLSLWQKILSAVGLYKAPARKPNAPAPPPDREARPPKSNTRNARSGDSEPREKRPEGDRPPREPREPRARDTNRPRGGDPKSVESTRVYVGNLSYDVSEQDLQELFKGIGGVRNIEIVYNRSTHRSKGYGFVEMLRMDEAMRAVEVLHDQPFMGRNMTVSGAKSKGNDEREDKDELPERESRPVVLASTSPAVEAQVEAAAEPGLQELPASDEPAPAGEISSVSASDLEAKYGFEPEEETKEKTEPA
ncbi:MAG: RNA-binding protein [Akkermansiaceae bacterium]